MSTLKVWGDDTYGQVSDAPDGHFKAIAGGSINGLALRRDGTPVLWGRSTAQLGAPPIRRRCIFEKSARADRGVTPVTV